METQTLPRWTISDRLVKARDFAGMTQDDIASALGMSRRTVVRHEHSPTPPRWFVLAYAEATHVPATWLFDEPGDQGISTTACNDYTEFITLYPDQLLRAAA
jgi:DNA-binding XRE family transcriptional regulator